MADEFIGKRIGGYEVQDLIGHGGMATVYRAQQVSMNRVVALKILPRQFVNDEAYLQRFMREVQIVSQLEHRNIVPVYDYGEEEGQPYIVMRYMPGGSVDERLKGGPLPLDETLRITEQIAPALDYAHGKSVLHRDLKPSNVLMDDNGGAYLTDFGIARILSEGSSNITTQGVVGTPSYMSPEQAQGRPLNNRSDLYSLGVMLFEMTTGKRPFESETPYGIAVMQVTTPPPAPRSINENVPPGVEHVILTAMNKSPEDRYPDAAALTTALQRGVNPPSILHDTQPKLAIPAASLDATVPITPAEIADVYVPPSGYVPPVSNTPPPISPYPPMSPVPQNPSPSGGYPMVPPASGSMQRVRPVRRRGNGLFTSLMLGGALGCGLITLLLIVVAIVVTNNQNSGTVTPDGPTPNAATLTIQAGSTALFNRAATLTAAAASRSGTPNGTSAPTRTGQTGASAGATLIPVGEQTSPPRPVQGASGIIVFFAERDSNFDLYSLDLESGVERRLTRVPADDLFPAASPDGSRIAFLSNRDGDYDVYVMPVDGSSSSNISNNDVDDRAPSWSPSGEAVLYATDGNGGTGSIIEQYTFATEETRAAVESRDYLTSPRWIDNILYVIIGQEEDAASWDIARVAMTGEQDDLERITGGEDSDMEADVAPFPDAGLLYSSVGDGFSAIWTMEEDGGLPNPLFDGPGYDWGAIASPDGGAVLFTSDETGRDELYYMNANGTNVRQVTENGGMGGTWLQP